MAFVVGAGGGCADLLGADFDRPIPLTGPLGRGDVDGSAPDGESAREAEAEPEPQGTVAEPEPASAGGCKSGRVLCDDLCVSRDDPRFGCGATDCKTCSLEHATAACDGGACAVGTCSSGFADCNELADDGCEVDTRTDPKHCGGCGVACEASEVCTPQGCASTCPNGTQKCGQACVDVATDAAHCGACDRVCPTQANADAVCVARTCKVACRAGFESCGGVCKALRAFYRDDDGDGVGRGASTLACSAPPGFVAATGDCHDGNADVFPGQTFYFAAPYTRFASSTKSFDYDCDGVEAIEHVAETCPIPEGAGMCTLGVDGWCSVRDPAAGAGRTGTIDPGCGQFGYECRAEPSGYGWYYSTSTALGCR